MKRSIKTLIVVLLSVMSLAALPADRAEGIDLLKVEGTIFAVDRADRTIEIAPDPEGDNVLINGFPFDYLDRVLSDMGMFGDIEIAADDCVTVVYVEDEKKETVINRAVVLTRYCKQCAVTCYEDSEGILIVEIDDHGDFYPVNKHLDEDDPGESHKNRKDNR